MEGAKSNYYGKQFQQISCFMSTTKALLENLTEIPVINTCYCFQILTNFIVLAKKITSQPGIDCISRHIVTEGACNEFSGAMLKRGRYVMYVQPCIAVYSPVSLCIALYSCVSPCIAMYSPLQLCIALYSCVLNTYYFLYLTYNTLHTYRAKQDRYSYTQLYRVIHG